jgi:hypothetical protein
MTFPYGYETINRTPPWCAREYLPKGTADAVAARAVFLLPEVAQGFEGGVRVSDSVHRQRADAAPTKKTAPEGAVRVVA